MGTKMKNAPVYFTVAQIKHNAILRLDSYAPDIQDRMRKAGYPDVKKDASLSLSFKPQVGRDTQPPMPQIETVDRLMFFNMEGTKGFVVNQNALSFQTTDYDTFDPFADEFLEGAAIVHDCVDLAITERVGLRYLDAVVPPEGSQSLSGYLAPGVLGLNTELSGKAEIGLSIAETRMQTEQCAVLTRTVILNGRLGFPMDFPPNGLNIAERFQKIDGLHAILDTDASIETRAAFDLDVIRSQLKVLRDGVDLAFRATITPAAFDAWQ